MKNAVGYVDEEGIIFEALKASIEINNPIYLHEGKIKHKVIISYNLELSGDDKHLKLSTGIDIDKLCKKLW